MYMISIPTLEIIEFLSSLCSPYLKHTLRKSFLSSGWSMEFHIQSTPAVVGKNTNLELIMANLWLAVVPTAQWGMLNVYVLILFVSSIIKQLIFTEPIHTLHCQWNIMISGCKIQMGMLHGGLEIRLVHQLDLIRFLPIEFHIHLYNAADDLMNSNTSNSTIIGPVGLPFWWTKCNKGPSWVPFL